MKSLTGKFASSGGWALLLILLLGAGLFVAACGDEDVPTPTTPAPPPPPPPAPPPTPEPEPEPEAPAVPVGLRISGSGTDFVEWSWMPVADVSGYDVQFSPNEAFTGEDEIIARTAEEISYRRDGLAEATSAFLRVRSAAGTGEDRITSDWSTHVTGMTEAPTPEPEPEPPAMPTGLTVSDSGEDFIEWSWDPVAGAGGYDVQFSENQIFSDEDETISRSVEEVSYRREELEMGTSYYLRVRSAAGTGEDRITSDWSTHVTGMTDAAPPPPEPPATPTGLMVSATTETSITWTWNAVDGADGYVVQANMDEMFDLADTVLFNGQPFTTETSYTRTDLDPETTVYVRVAAGVGTPADHLLSAFTNHVTGMTMAAAPEAPAAPANLRVKDRGSDYIEWEWDEVDGADGYHAQFSTNSGFSVTDDQFLQGMSNTTHKVSNLESEEDGYLRVRAYVGTATDRVFGEWSGADKASTDEPPPAVPLAAPDGLEASDETEESITLEWDSVRNADSYEVEQREPGDGWEDASCGGGDNAVEDEECVASGLDEGTDYDFRVRAIPADDDDAYTTSDWSDVAETRTDGTAAPEPTTPTSGGMGDLNIEWETTETGVTFIWDRVADSEYETFVLEGYSDDPEPCEGVEFVDKGRNTSEPVPADRGLVRGLCVQTTDEDNRRLSFAWGATTPEDPMAGAAPTEDGKTTSMTWSNIEVIKDFNYAVRLVADTGREDGMFSSTAAPTNALQNACANGTLLDDGLADVTLMGLTETVDSGIRHFTGYTLCLQYSNDSGATSWAVPMDGANLDEIHTTPGTPPAPRFDRGTNNPAGTDRTLAWTVPVRNSADVPREHGGFEALIIHYPVRYDHDGDGADASPTALRTTPQPTATTCEDPTDTPSNLDGGNNPWTRVSGPDLGTSLDGVTVETPSPIAIPVNTGENLYVRLCVRATRSSAGGTTVVNGPWRIGGATTITKQAPPF